MDYPILNSSTIDVGVLSSLFNNTTNSYKYVFFLSLLRLLEEQEFKVDAPISLDALSTEMLVTAWYPHSFFRLNLGRQDQIGRVLNEVDLDVSDRSVMGASGRKRLRAKLGCEEVRQAFDLTRYVPYRLIRGFFTGLVQDIPDHQIKGKIFGLASKEFETRRPLYCFDPSSNGLFMHPAWADYFCQNQQIVLSWASWKWAEYMQLRNPSIPGITQKLFPPEQRTSLYGQRKFWAAVLKKTAIQCIYTGKMLKGSGPGKAFALDHFLPWKFVVHDQLWNLIPVDPVANASKSDRLPSRQYLDAFVSVQHSGLVDDHYDFDGYRRLSFIRASVAVKRQFTVAFLPFRSRSQAAISDVRISASPIRRSKHWSDNTAISISTIFNQLACLGV